MPSDVPSAQASSRSLQTSMVTSSQMDVRNSNFSQHNVYYLSSPLAEESGTLNGSNGSFQSTGNDKGHSERAAHEIYHYYFLAKKRGLPLWIPNPNLSLPVEYRTTGVSIGDVGIFESQSGFSFLFNIFLDANHAINRGRVPQNFSPMSEKVQIESNRLYDAHSYLASPSLSVEPDRNSSDLLFKASGGEGAILTMPEGSSTQDLYNTQLLKRYVADNVIKWYEYATSPNGHGREVDNGGLLIVIGCDKVPSWGIATFSNKTRREESLEFIGNDGVSGSKTYQWYCRGTGIGRTGPHVEDMHDLRREPNVSLRNQCVFVRTMEVTLSDKIWKESIACQVPAGGEEPSRQTVGEVYMNLNPTRQHMWHPLAFLNRHLLENYPNVEMVITQDHDWISVLTEEDTVLPHPEEICKRVLASHQICESDGFITLKRKDDNLKTAEKSSPPRIDHAMIPSISERMSGFSLSPSTSLMIQIFHLATSPVPFVAAGAKLLSVTVDAIEHVKLYKTQCKELTKRCVKLLVTIQENAIGLERNHIIELGDELEYLLLSINQLVKEWSNWTGLRSFLQKGDIKDAVEILNRQLDSCMMKFQIFESHPQINPGNQDLKAYDNFEIREVLETIVKSHEDIKTLLHTHSTPAVKEVVESLQTQLREPYLQPAQEEVFKEGLSMLRENNLTGQITLGWCFSNDTIIGTYDQKEVALHRPRALVDTPEVRDLFRRKVAIWVPLFHPNVVKIHGMVYINDGIYFVTDWLECNDLSSYLRESSEVDRLNVLSGVAAGLEYLHENGIIHGDLRAVNISVSKEGIACLRNFGHFEFLKDDFNTSNSDGLRWAAPEVLKNYGAVSMCSDVWSFGMLCLEVLTGDVPFSGKSDDEVRRQLDQEKYPDHPGGFSKELWDLMRRCWHKDPERRPSMTGVKAAIRDIMMPPFSTARRTSTHSGFFSHLKGKRPATSNSSTNSTTSKSIPLHEWQLPQYIEVNLRNHSQSNSEPMNHSLSNWPDEGGSTSEHKRSWPRRGKSIPTLPPLTASSICKFSGQPSKTGPGVTGSILGHRLSSNGSSFITPEELFSPKSVPPPVEPSDDLPFHFDTQVRPLVLNVVDGAILSGTLEGLTKFLIDFGFQGRRDFFNTFFMGWADFTTPQDLFDYLSYRFFEVEIDKNIQIKERIDTQMSIIDIVKYWIKDGNFAPSDKLFQSMKSFCGTAIQVKLPVPTVANKLRNLLQAIETQIRHTPIISEISGPIHKSSRIKPRDLAIGLTLLEGDYFRALRPHDYIMHLTKGLSDNINQIFQTKSKIRAWIIDRILHYDSIRWRSAILKFFIETAFECQELRNYSSWINIAFAVHAAPISNLEFTRKALSSAMTNKLSTLRDIINPDSDYRHFRAAINKIASPRSSNICVPWLDLHLKDLQRILDDHPVTVRVGDNLINFERYTKFMDRINEVAHYTPPNLQEYRNTGQLEYLLDSLQKFPISNNTDTEMLTRSLVLKERERSDANQRKHVLARLGF